MDNSLESFWNDPEHVKRFADRDPDHRLVELVPKFKNPQETRVLDIGCAGGRNTVYLSGLGFDVSAIDASGAMVEETRQRLAHVLGEGEAAKRVHVGKMDDLSSFSSNAFDMIVALGVYHNAQDQLEWERSLSESARVLKSQAFLLVSNFDPKSRPRGEALVPHTENSNIFDGFGPGPMYLIDAQSLDADLAKFGFRTELPTETVRAETDTGYRYTINGLYRKF